MKQLVEVVNANRDAQVLAQNLNLRAGEEVFPVMTSAEFEVWLESRLGGAVSVETIPNLDALKLPPLSTDAMKSVYVNNPDYIVVCGRNFAVDYPAGGYDRKIHPQIMVHTDTTNWWMNLPNEGVKLPGGRLVNVVIRVSSWHEVAAGTDIPALKQTVKSYLNESQWSNFLRPARAVPTGVSESTVLPEIKAVVYGKCVVTREDLVAYTYTAYTARDSWTGVPVFKTVWRRDRAEAESELASSRLELEARKRTLRQPPVQPVLAPGTWLTRARDAERRRRDEEDNRMFRDVIEWDRVRDLDAEAQGMVAVREQVDSAYRREEVQTSFTEMSNRWFKCDQGHTLKVEKSDWQQYLAGETLSLTCTICGGHGKVTKK